MNMQGLIVVPREERRWNGRIVGLAVVIAVHVGLVLALLMGLGHQMVEVLQKPLITKIIEAPKPPPPPPRAPLPTPTLAPPPPAYVPPPEVAVNVPATAQNAITAVTRVQPPARTAPVIDAARACPEPAYPPIARRLEQSGTVVLGFLIGVEGQVVSGHIAQSSGYPLLDKAALGALSRCRFRPGTIDGKAVQSWATLKYVWRLQD